MLIEYSTKLKREIKDIKQQAELDLKKACEIYEKRCRTASNIAELTKKQDTKAVHQSQAWQKFVNRADAEINNTQIDAADVAVDAIVKKKKKMKDEPLVS